VNGKTGKVVAAKRLRDGPGGKETWIEQAASFIGFFIYLLILKSFFLPLFIIPTGSMAATLYGAHALYTCPNCGTEYAVGWQQPPNWRPDLPYHPRVFCCPNCRWQRIFDPRGADRLQPVAGDRIFVHGWLPGRPPARWDVVVFKVPTDGQQNYIKRLIGLPGEEIELIDGDVFVNGQIVGKTRQAQQSLWFPYYDHDYLPSREYLGQTQYFPHWAALDDTSPWSGLDTRVLRFDGLGQGRSEIQFGTDPRDWRRPGVVQDFYAYNEPRVEIRPNVVADVRLSAEVELLAGPPGGYVELSITRRQHRFFARLNADRTVTLNCQVGDRPERQTWGRWQAPSSGPLCLALCHVDGTVQVEANGNPVIRSTPDQYRLTPEIARASAGSTEPPLLRIAAQDVRAVLRHVLVERDIYYTSDIRLGPDGRRPGYGVQGNPIRLGPEDYFVLGDNSPSSLDARFAFAGGAKDPVGPHLKRAAAEGRFQPGTVPADQMIGPAFFVYWPGFLPLTPSGPSLLPDMGRARWIR